MAALPSNRVHQGFWIDYTRGPILGATITTTSSSATFIIALLSVLAAFTGSHLWDLIAFVRYWTGVSKYRRSALHHQVQILARNITSPGAFLLEVTKVGWSWRRDPALYSLCAVAALAFICSAGFLVIGIFVSQVVTTSGLQVLVHSDSCGWLSWRNETGPQQLEYQQLVFTQALAYLDTCYDKAGPLSQCNIYVKQAIPIQKMSHTACPFGDLRTNHSALSLDTGLLDSNDVFGINTNLDLRVKMQRVIACTPIDPDRYSTTRPIPPEFLRQYEGREALPKEQLFEWFLGPLTGSLRPFNSTVWQSNYTAMFSNVIDLTPRAYYVPTDGGPITGWHSSTFYPIPELRREDADTHVIVVQNNGLRYYASNDDPLFAAHKEKHILFDDNSNRTMYTADQPASFLGCTEQMRFCFTQGGCTQLLGAGFADSQAQKIAPTSQQRAILHYLFILTPTVYGVTRAPMLVSRNANSFQLGIPSDQWEAEVKAWMNFLLVVTQTTITHIAAGPGIVRSDFDELVEPVEWPDLCSSQRMGAPDGYSNINIFGLVLVVLLSGIIILTNLILVPILKYRYRRNPQFSWRMTSWVQEGLLQVQRKAYEAAGFSDWSNLEASVPRTKELVPGLCGDIPLGQTDGSVLGDDESRRSESAPSSVAAFDHLPPLSFDALAISADAAPISSDLHHLNQRRSSGESFELESLSLSRRRSSSATRA